eukprot:4397765-Pleurochrysis_carterae.AAC.3
MKQMRRTSGPAATQKPFAKLFLSTLLRTNLFAPRKLAPKALAARFLGARAPAGRTCPSSARRRATYPGTRTRMSSDRPSRRSYPAARNLAQVNGARAEQHVAMRISQRACAAVALALHVYCRLSTSGNRAWL